jgi:hypothetical protein
MKSTSALVKAINMEWSNFAWQGEKEKEALYVPVKFEFDASTHWLQLDTGCNRSIIYDVPLRQLTGRSEFKDKYFVLNGKMGNYEFKNERFRIKRNYGKVASASEKSEEIGVLGLNFLMRRILTIDYPNERFCICDSLTELPEELLKKAEFTRVRIRFGAVFLEELEFNDKPLKGIIFDTGASKFTLVFALESRWEKYAGKKGTQQGNCCLEVPGAWGEKVSLVGAKAKGVLRLRSLQTENPMIYFTPHIPNVKGIRRLLVRTIISVFRLANGLMGNEPFYNEYTVILDLQQNRFGFLKSLTNAPRP